MFIKNDYAFFTQIVVFCSHIYQIPRPHDSIIFNGVSQIHYSYIGTFNITYIWIILHVNVFLYFSHIHKVITLWVRKSYV